MVEIKEILKNQKTYFESSITKDVNFRIEKLKLLRSAILEYEDRILEALKLDLNKAPFEAYTTEIYLTLEEIKYSIKNLPKWGKPKKVQTSITSFGAKSYIVHEPYGVCLIMSPWNYPFQLSVAPLIGAIAGGNCSFLKLSEYSPNTSRVIMKMLKQYFEDDYIYVIEGNPEINTSILNEKFDYIFFTGSVHVGKIVMNAAAKNLTPITLELGGKSPCIVDKSADIFLAAKRIVWGKFVNVGQTCVAPDYLFVHREVKDKLIDEMQKIIIKFYGDNPLENEDYPKIINEKHFSRLINLLDSQKVIFGGKHDKNTLKIQPTLVSDVDWDSPIMKEEIFGPLLPIFEYRDLSDVIARIKSFAKPLALYLFTRDKNIENIILNSISFGGGCINDTIMHIATVNMPFGGVGESGLGSYHGEATFNAFSHKKTILKQTTLFDIALRYPPYGDKLKWLKRML